MHSTSVYGLKLSVLRGIWGVSNSACSSRNWRSYSWRWRSASYGRPESVFSDFFRKLWLLVSLLGGWLDHGTEMVTTTIVLPGRICKWRLMMQKQTALVKEICIGIKKIRILLGLVWRVERWGCWFSRASAWSMICKRAGSRLEKWYTRLTTVQLKYTDQRLTNTTLS